MDSQYLKSSVGPILASALTQLYAYGINTHDDPTHPHRDPIGFLGRYLLDYDAALKDMARDAAQKQHLDSLQRQIAATSAHYKDNWGAVVGQLDVFLSQRELEKEMKLKMAAEAEAQAAAAEQARLEAEEAKKVAEVVEKKKKSGDDDSDEEESSSAAANAASTAAATGGGGDAAAVTTDSAAAPPSQETTPATTTIEGEGDAPQAQPVATEDGESA